MDKDRANFNLIWPIALMELLKKEASLHDVSASQLLATALLLVPQHHDEMADQIVAMRHEYFPRRPRALKEVRPYRSRRRAT